MSMACLTELVSRFALLITRPDGFNAAAALARRLRSVVAVSL